jgi:hypothetical protein
VGVEDSTVIKAKHPLSGKWSLFLAMVLRRRPFDWGHPANLLPESCDPGRSNPSTSQKYVASKVGNDVDRDYDLVPC